MVKYQLLDKQREFIEIPHSNSLDVAIYQGGYGSGKTWCGSLLGILLAKKYPLLVLGKIIRFLYQKKVTYSYKMVIKICKIQVFSKKLS